MNPLAQPLGVHAEPSRMTDALDWKLNRAHKHIDDLRTEMARFLDSDPYASVYAADPHQLGQRLVRLYQVDEMPPSILIIVGDVLHNLRSALDHLYYRLVLAAGNSPSKRDQFPVCDSAEKFASARCQVVGRIGPEPLKLIDALKPYKGGCNPIWCLHSLSNIDKHRTVMTVGIKGQVRIPLHQPAAEPMPALGDSSMFEQVASITLAPPFPLENRSILASIPDPQASDYVDLALEIAFNEPGVIEAEPVIQALDCMANVTERVVEILRPFCG